MWRILLLLPKLIPDKDLEGTAYAAKIINDKIYLGTSTGLYQQDWKTNYNPLVPNEFKLVKGSEGQVWKLNQLDEALFLGHHDAGYLLKNEELERITTSFGVWIL